MNKLIMAIALAATVALSGCATRSETPVTAEPVEAVSTSYRPPAVKAGTPAKVTETAVANCVAETRKMESNKHLPKKLSGFRRLAAGTEATLAGCAGGEKVLIQYLVDDDGKVVGHESLWSEVRAALEASALAQAEPDTTARDNYIAAYNDGVKDTKATAAKQARADKALADKLESDRDAMKNFWFITIILILLAILAVMSYRMNVGSKRRTRPAPSSAKTIAEEPAPQPQPASRRTGKASGDH